MPKIQYIAELAARRWRTSPLAGPSGSGNSVGDSLQKPARAPTYSEGLFHLYVPYPYFLFLVLQSAVGPSVKTERADEPIPVPKLDSGQLSLTIDLTREPEDILGLIYYFLKFNFYFLL